MEQKPRILNLILTGLKKDNNSKRKAFKNLTSLTPPQENFDTTNASCNYQTTNASCNYQAGNSPIKLIAQVLPFSDYLPYEARHHYDFILVTLSAKSLQDKNQRLRLLENLKQISPSKLLFILDQDEFVENEINNAMYQFFTELKQIESYEDYDSKEIRYSQKRKDAILEEIFQRNPELVEKLPVEKSIPDSPPSISNSRTDLRITASHPSLKPAYNLSWGKVVVTMTLTSLGNIALLVGMLALGGAIGILFFGTWPDMGNFLSALLTNHPSNSILLIELGAAGVSTLAGVIQGYFFYKYWDSILKFFSSSSEKSLEPDLGPTMPGSNNNFQTQQAHGYIPVLNEDKSQPETSPSSDNPNVTLNSLSGK